MPKVAVKEIRFNTSVSMREIPYFRAGLCRLVGEPVDALMHNHKQDGLRYGYPLVQYQSEAGKGKVVALGNGIEAVAKLELIDEQSIQIGNRERLLSLQSSSLSVFDVDFLETPVLYTISNWLPFSSENEKEYEKITSLREKIAYMEHVLTANVLTFAKGLGFFFDNEVKISIKDITESTRLKYKNVMFRAFSLSFYSNVSLPGGIGLGKHVSHGFGTIRNI